MKTFFKILVGLILVGAIGYTMYFLYQKSQTAPVIYETDSPVILDIVKKTTATGSVVPRKEIEIKPIVSGIIDELYVVEGEMIKKGDLINKYLEIYLNNNILISNLTYDKSISDYKNRVLANRFHCGKFRLLQYLNLLQHLHR